MKLILENWRKYLSEQRGGKLWVVAGPPAVGKSYLMKKIESLKIPGLIIQDMDYIPAVEAATPSFNDLPPEQRDTNHPKVIQLIKAASPKMNAAIKDFIQNNTGKDMFLVGIAWLDPRLPFQFPANAEKIYLYRDPAVVVQAYLDRPQRTGDSPKTTELNAEDREAAEANVINDYKQYEAQGWTKMSPEQIEQLVKSSYVEGADETPT